MRLTSLRWLAYAVMVSMVATLPVSAQVFVVPGGAGNQDGTSWDNAYGDLQAALDDERAADDDVWVAGGTYAVSNISWPSGVQGYGGFEGTETSEEERDDRDYAANETILDAENNSRGILVVAGANNVRIDGFTVMNAINDGGDAWWGDFAGTALSMDGSLGDNTIINCRFANNGLNAEGDNAAGNGNVFLQTSSPLIENCIFEDNAGSAMASAILVNDGSQPLIRNCTFRNNESESAAVRARDQLAGENPQPSHPTIENCLFENNEGYSAGAGVAALGGDPAAGATIINSHFINNHAGVHGGAVFVNSDGELIIEGSYFEGNSADSHGGTISIQRTNEEEDEGATVNISNSLFVGNHGGGISSVLFAWNQPTVVNMEYCTAYGNTGGNGYVLRADGSTMNLSNSIVWGNDPGDINVNVTNSITEGGAGGGMDEDPLFTDADAGDFRLQSGSPGIGIGTSPVPEADFEGVARFEGVADIGAFQSYTASIVSDGFAVLEMDAFLTAAHNLPGDDVTYTWYKDGELIEDEEFETLPILEVTEEDAGLYSVEITDGEYEVSASLQLDVVEALPVSSPVVLLLLAMSMALAGMLALRKVRA